MSISRKKILLIEPPFHRLYKDSYSLDRYPLGLGYLAETILRDTDWEVEAYNADFTPNSEWAQIKYMTNEGFHRSQKLLSDTSASIWSEIANVIRKTQCSVVGISMKSQNAAASCIIARIAKEIDPQMTVIVGGPHPSMVKSDVLREPAIDVAAMGEGEHIIVELLHAFERGSDLHPINGIAFRSGSDIVLTPSRAYIEDLDALPFPNEHAETIMRDFASYPKQEAQIFATRGCPYDCFFCGSKEIWSRRVRFRSPMNVVREMQQLQRKGYTKIAFEDDTFGVHKRYIHELCTALIEHVPSIRWSCELHVNLIDEATLAIMQRAGCTLIRIGIESGNDFILKEMRKNYTIGEAMNAVDMIQSFGIETHTFFMVGFPQETVETLQDTARAMKRVRSDTIIYSIFTPYPGTEAFAYCRENGLIDSNYDVSKYSHQSPLNHFSTTIPYELFREKAREIEALVDRKNRRTNLRKQWSLDKLSRIPSYGISNSVRLLYRLIRGR